MAGSRILGLALAEGENEMVLDIELELRELKKRKIRKILELEYELGSIDPVLAGLKKLETNLKQKLKVQTAEKHNNNYMWITINPKPSVALGEFRKVITRILTKTCFADVLACYEQRAVSKEDLGKGFHVHILVKRNLNYKPIKLKQNIKNSCKKIVGNINADYSINLQTIGTEFAKDKKQYILGEKYGKDDEGNLKKDKQSMDDIWRKQEGINAYYGNKNIV